MRISIGLAWTFLLLSLGSVSTLAQQSSAPATAVIASKPAIEPQALALLEAMSDTLAAANGLSFTARGAFDVPAANGQPLFYMTLSEVAVQRPDKLRVIVAGDGPPSEFYYDGKTITSFIPKENLVAVADAPANLEAMLEVAYDKAGIYFPFVDFIVADPYKTLTNNLTHAFVIGQSMVVGGTTTDILAIANDEVQAQIWIGADDRLPRLIWATPTKMPEKPRHSIEFSNWKLNSPAGEFASAQANKAVRIEFARPDVSEK